MSINITGTLVPASSSFGIALATDIIGGSAPFANEAAISAIASGRLSLLQESSSQASLLKYRLDSLVPSGIFSNGTWSIISGTGANGTWSAVKLASTSNVSSLSGAATIDGVAVATNDRVLLTGQTTASQNGLWVANTAGAWARATDAANTSDFVVGKTVFVTGGSTLANTIWGYNGAASPTVGTTAISFGENASGGGSFNPASPGDIGTATPGSAQFVSVLLQSFVSWKSGTSQFFGFSAPVFSSDADLTVATNAYASPVLRVVSTATLTQKRKLILPFGGPWFVYNGTTGGQTITVIGPSGTGIDIPNGGFAVVCSNDNANFYGTGTGSGSSTTLDTSIHTASFTASANTEYLLDPSAGSFPLTLPNPPTVNSTVDVWVVGNCDDSHTITLTAAGSGVTVRDPFRQTDGATAVINRVGHVRLKYVVNGSLKTWAVA